MYSQESDWNFLCEDISDYWVGTQGTAVQQRVFKKINERLLSLGYDTPLSTGLDGSYSEALIDLESNWVIYHLIKRRIRGEAEGEPDWLKTYWWEATAILGKIKKGQIVLSVDLPPYRSGIGEATKATANQGSAYFYTNHDGYKSYFLGTDFPLNYIIKVATATTEGRLFDTEFEWSWDNGVSFHPGTCCSTEWVSVGTGDKFRGVYARWELSAIASQVFVDDQWTFKAWPKDLKIQADKDTWKSREILIT